MKIIMVKVGGKEYPTIIDEKGIQRFIEDKVISYLVNEEIIDLNKVYKAYHMGKFSKREFLEFMMSIGYSVSGIAELQEFWNWRIENPLWEKQESN